MFTSAEQRAIGEIARAEGVLPEAHVLAVVQVESAGQIFATIDGRQEPVIRFEGHYFYRRLKGDARDRAVREKLAHPTAGRIANPRSQAGRWRLLQRAMAIDPQAALESVSWGAGQVMGSHWPSLGYASVHALVAKARSALDDLNSVRLFGPADAPVSMIRGRHRVRMLAQSGKDFDLSGYVRFWLGTAEKPKGDLKVQVDIDPMSFM